MPLDIKYVDTAIRAAGAIVAFIPGAVVLKEKEALALPVAMVEVVTVVSFSLSLLVVFGVFLLDDWLAQLSKKRTIVYAALALGAGGGAAISYAELVESYVVTLPPAPTPDQENRFVIPARPSAEFIEILLPANEARPTKVDYEHRLRGSRDALEFREDLYRESRWMRYLMYFVLLAAQVLLIAPVVAAAWKYAHSLSEPAGGRLPQRPNRHRRTAQKREDARARS